MAKKDSTPENHRRIVTEEVGKGVKRIADQVTGPLTSFLPSLVSQIPAGGMLQKMVKHLARPVEPPVVNVESGDKKGGALSAAEVEKANSEKRAGERQTTLLEKIAGGIGDMAKGFLKAAKSKGAFALGSLAGLVGGPVIMLVNFFKSLGAQVKWLNNLTGGRLAKMFAPFVRFFDAIDDIVKKGGTSKMMKGGTFKMFGRFSNTLLRLVGNIKRIIRPIMKAAKSSASFMKGFAKFGKFFAGFGRVLGRLFLPITILMSLWDGVTGFLDGFKESDGDSMLTKVIDGIGEGLGKIVGNLIGFPLNLLKDGVAWIGTKLGFDMSGFKELDFKKIIKDLISAPWNMLSKAIDWVFALFDDPKKALNDLWKGLMGDGGLIDIIFGPIDKGIAWVKGLFGWSTEGQEEFSIATFIKGIFTSVKDWFVGLFAWGKETGTNAAGDFSIFTLITGVFTSIKEWFKGLFAWGKETGTNAAGDFSIFTLIIGVFKSVKDWFKGLFVWSTDDGTNAAGDFTIFTLIGGVFTSIKEWFTGLFSWGKEKGTNAAGDFSFFTLIGGVFTSVKKWFTGLFTWGDPNEDGSFSLTTLLFDAVKGIFDWFKGLLDFDFMGLVSKIPGAKTIMKFFNKDEELKAAEESGLYDKDIVGASEIDKKKATTAPLEQLKAILADDDLRKKDKAYIEKLVADRSSALEAANAALEAAQEDKDNAGSGGAVLIDNSTKVNQQGGGKSTQTIPLVDNSVHWQTADMYT